MRTQGCVFPLHGGALE